MADSREVADLLGPPPEQVEGTEEEEITDAESFARYLDDVKEHIEPLAENAPIINPFEPETPPPLTLVEMVLSLDWVWKRDRRYMSRPGVKRLEAVRQSLKRLLDEPTLMPEWVANEVELLSEIREATEEE